jgi:hypothetical protein
MATKKSPSTISKSPSQTTSKKPTSSKASVTENPKATVRKKRATGKSTQKLAPTLTLELKRTASEPEISHEAISLRAYFIAERRHQMGWDGNSHTDWTDAMAQLRAEALEKPLKKR